jgi:hypothetical protein
MFYIYLLLLVNNTQALITADVSINKISNLPEFIEIKEIIKSENKEYIRTRFYQMKEGIQVIFDNLELDEIIDDATIIKTFYSDSAMDLEKEIDDLTNLRNRMLKIENLIQTTYINFDDLLVNYGVKNYSIAKFQNEKEQLNHLEKIRKELIHNEKELTPDEYRLYRRGCRDNRINPKVLPSIKEFEELGEKIRILHVPQNIANVDHTVNACYGIYQTENKKTHDFFEPDTILRAYTVKHYNNKLKKELEELETKFGSMSSIQDKLTFAYSKILEL